MDLASELREFLVTRRARITPQEAGIPVWDGERRVPGLRRSEVAALAGVSTDYYTKLERGVVTGVSANVAEAIANALRLDEAERLHWENLVVQLKAPPANNANGAPIDIAVRPGLQQVLVALAGTPAYLRTARRDILAANAMAEALFAPAFSRPARPVNIARFVFVDPAARSFFADWDGVAHAMAAALRLEVGRHPDDARLAGLIDSLLEQSERFREFVERSGCGFPSHWDEVVPASGGRPPRLGLRGRRAAGRSGSHPHHVHGTAGLARRSTARPTGRECIITPRTVSARNRAVNTGRRKIWPERVRLGCRGSSAPEPKLLGGVAQRRPVFTSR